MDKLKHARLAIRLGLVYCGLIAFYTFSAPANHNAADDVYFYAQIVRTFPLGEYCDTRLLLYFVTMRIAYIIGQTFGLDALQTMRICSILATSLAVIVFYFFLTRPLALERRAGLYGSAFFALGFGVWRYASEAEVYALMWLLSLLVALSAYYADRGGGRWPAVAGVGVVGGIAVLFYKPLAITLFLLLPLVFILRRRWLPLSGYCLSGGVVVLGGYLCAFFVFADEPWSIRAFSEFITMRDNELLSKPLSVLTIAKTFFVTVHNIVSLNWLFGYESLVVLLHSIAPYWDGTEEAFAAASIGALIYLPLITVPVLALIGINLTLIAVRQPAQQRMANPWFVFCLLWVISTIVVNLRFAADSFEAFESGLRLFPALAALVAVLLIRPCLQAGRHRVLVVGLIAFAIHNGLVGIGMVYSAGGDFYRQRTAWLIEHSTARDIVILTSPFDNIRHYLNYRGAAKVIDYQSIEAEQILADPSQTPGSVFVFDDFFSPAVGLAEASKPEYEFAHRFAAEFRNKRRLVHESDIGQIYELVLD